MQKTLLTGFKRLLMAALTAGALWSCQDEKPEIIIPDPVIPQKEFKYLETITPDTLTFVEGDSAVFCMRTIPYNLLSRDSITLQVSDTAGAKYPYANIKSYKMGTDSIWRIIMHMTYGMKSGDIISIMVADEDTVMYSDETVLNMITHEQAAGLSLRITNKESVAAFLEGSNATTINLRTNPWDMLFNDSNMVFLTDSLDRSFRKSLNVDSITFQPADSTWTMNISILDDKLDSIYVLVKLICGDSLSLLSDPVYIKKVNVAMTSVKTGNNATMKYSPSIKTYSYCLPTTTDFRSQKFMFIHNGDKAVVGDSIMKEGEYNILDANMPIKVSVWKYNVHQDYTIKITNTGLPIVRINTNGQSVTRRDTWVPGMTMRIEMPDGTIDYEGSMSMKGRGNGTWTETNKKPYAIKLDEKAKILGMHKQKRWILLANYKDRTLLRNDAAFWLSRNTEMPYTVSGEFVELVWNGKHMGNYYLCEQIRIDNNRVDIAQPNLTDPANGGMLIVIDDFLDYTSSDRYDKSPMVGFRSTGSNSRYKLPYVLKDPDEDENGNLLTSSSPTFTYLKNYVKNMEDAIYDMKEHPNNKAWREYLDMDAAIDYVLIQEITMNHDSYNTWPKAGPHSAYLYKDSCDKLCYGPVWDFDYHTFALKGESSSWGGWGGGGGSSSGENPRLTQWELLKMDNKGNNKYYFADLVKYDPEFKARLIERWNMYKNTWKEGLPKYIDEMANKIRTSESYNWSIWGLNNPNGKQNGDEDLSFQQAVNNMKEAFLKRWNFIDQNISSLGK